MVSSRPGAPAAFSSLSPFVQSIDKIFGDSDLAALLPIGEALALTNRGIKSAKRAKLSCPRWSIKPDHLRQLEEIFEEVQMPSLALRQALAEQMGVTSRQVGRELAFRVPRVPRGPQASLIRGTISPPREPPPPSNYVTHA